MDKIVLVDKPQGFTSFDVVAKLRKILKTKKIGHTGTLDPMATGVLACLVGRATKLCELLPCEDKTYCAEFKLGISTDTQDITGTVIRSVESHVTVGELKTVIQNFIGDISQQVPMYSAVSVNGKRLYELARKGIEVERPIKQITFYSIELQSFDEATQQGSIEVSCSKGSYIRTLIQDIGDSLAVGGTLTSLRRTKSHGFDIEDCCTLETLQSKAESDTLADVLLEPWVAYSHLAKIETGQWQKEKLANGVALMLDKFNNPAVGSYTLWMDREFLGVCEVCEGTDKIKIIYNACAR